MRRVAIVTPAYNPGMLCPQLTSFAAPEGVSPDVGGPVDRPRLANGRSTRTGAACKASVPFGRPGGH
jgi:hypothetical protein